MVLAGSFLFSYRLTTSPESVCADRPKLRRSNSRDTALATTVEKKPVWRNRCGLEIGAHKKEKIASRQTRWQLT